MLILKKVSRQQQKVENPASSGPLSFTDQKDQRPQSNIWPPPKNKDYQRTVRDLPENVKLAERKNDEQQNKTSDKPGESSSESSGRPKEMDITSK